MYVKKLQFENFRNLKDGYFQPSTDINVIYGDNAQGKTNLVEAIWLFCGQKSFRMSKDNQLIKISEKPLTAKLTMDFYSRERNQQATIVINKKRSATINGIDLKTPTDLAQYFCAVIFSPSDMEIINEGPYIRRKFLDVSIAMIRPKYNKMLNIYNRAVMQRNMILKDIVYHSQLSTLLDSFEQTIAGAGSYIISQRRKYIDALRKAAQEIYYGLSSTKEKLYFEYNCSCNDGDYQSILEQLYNNRQEDIRTATTSKGPHRDDIEFSINGLPVKNFGSQGQKRSVVLSLKLAQADILKNYANEQPVAILDDVMSELDNSRNDYILNHIKNWQVFITCCNMETVNLLKAGSCFKMENGVIKSG